MRQGDRVVNRLKAGDHFGEIAPLDNGPRTATVVTTTPIRRLVLSPRQFQDVLHQDAEIAVTLLRSVTERMLAYMRPCWWSGVIACRRLSWFTLKTVRAGARSSSAGVTPSSRVAKRT